MSETRLACCMLCVTITIVYLSRSSRMSSSIFAVAIGIECGTGLVHQKHLGFHGEGAGDAEPLLLSAGDTHSGLFQVVLHFVPKRGHAERFFESLVEDLPIAHSVQSQPDEHVLLDRHGRKGIRFLENHSDPAANHRGIDPGGVKVFAAKQNLAFHPRARDELVHSVKATEEGRFPATARPDDRGDRFRRDRDRDVLDRALFAVPDREILHVEGGRMDGRGGRAAAGVGSSPDLTNFGSVKTSWSSTLFIRFVLLARE